tara:strand:- start:1984 stop:2214 length:231 start_codon:yes stop_codon:yes gene_type:complete
MKTTSNTARIKKMVRDAAPVNRPSSTGEGVRDDTTDEFEAEEVEIATADELLLHDSKLGKRFILVAYWGHDPFDPF